MCQVSQVKKGVVIPLCLPVSPFLQAAASASSIQTGTVTNWHTQRKEWTFRPYRTSSISGSFPARQHAGSFAQTYAGAV